MLPLTSEDLQACGSLRARLDRAGKPIGSLDLLIAAHAVAGGILLVMKNELEFSRVRDLRSVNRAQ